MPTWQLPDALHVTLEPLPTTGGKVAKASLQSPSFRQRALLDNLAQAQQRLSLGGESCIMQRVDDHARSEALYWELRERGDPMSLLSFHGNHQMQLPEWLQLLGAMDPVELVAFTLQARSLTKTWRPTTQAIQTVTASSALV